MSRQTSSRSASAEHSQGTASEWERFGERVRAVRERLGLSVEELAEGASASPHRIRQVESGSYEPQRNDARRLDSALQAEGVLWDAWAQTFITAGLRAGATVADLLPQAFQVRAYAPLVLPDGFLTEDYARALNRVERPMEADFLIPDRPTIREVCGTFPGPPYYCLIADEASLTRPVASPSVMRAQLTRLRDLATGDRVTVHLLPQGTAPHPGLRGAFWTLAFSPRHSLAYTPHPRGPGHLVTDATHIKGYADLFSTLQGVALSATDSLRLLDQVIERFPDKPRRRALTTGLHHGTSDTYGTAAAARG
ncbi:MULTISPECIES: helix-turn-helix domain-containing protein [Nocardiopsis]|uniref:helix-turn-helix domain-containing protein n=1 Tax=Nocardiopsis TaxID=2013 RepID=UPI000988A423|nr:MULTISPECIES: helix-turn-helix transcriptional regulator [Nocardiopsis]